MPRYTLDWRNKFLTSDATSLPEMVAALQAAAKTLEAMWKDGVTLDHEEGSMADDYAVLTTTDPAVAKKFGFGKS